MYSIEWIPKSDLHNAWNQWALHDSKWRARISYWNMRLNHQAFNHNYRIRELS